MVRGFEPHTGLCADSLEPGAALDSVYPALSPSPCLSSVSQKQINVKKKRCILNINRSCCVFWMTLFFKLFIFSFLSNTDVVR